MEIWLCRHGESVAEVNKVMQGQADGDLTEIGIIQSQLLAFRLSFPKFLEIFSSDSQRAQLTTKEILKYNMEVSLEFDSKLRERALGSFEGKSLINMKIQATKQGISLRDFKPADGESWNEVFERAQGVLNNLITKYVKIDFSEKVVPTNIDVNGKQSKLERSQTISQPLKINLPRSQSSKIQLSKNPEETFNGVKRGTTIELNYMDMSNSNKEELEEIDYTSINIKELMRDQNYCKRMSKVYKGFKPELTFPRVLIVSHSGFIMEFLNCIRVRKNIRMKFMNDSLPTGLYIIKIYCVNCGSVCYSKDESCKLEYDMIIYNNTDHLNISV